jgi:hypothetical protein
VDGLSTSFEYTKAFCDTHGLTINADKTQLILLHAPGKKIEENIVLSVGGVSLKPVKSVKLLGVVIDSGLTFSPHIDAVITKCQGLLGALAKSAPFLPTELLRMAYISLIRSHLEYSSAVWASAAPTHLKKLDIIQKAASRIISHAPRGAHSEPLIRELRLQSLSERRERHVMKIVEACIREDYHPALNPLFELQEDDIDGMLLAVDVTGRINIGKRRFSIFARELYNRTIGSTV